MLCRMRLLTVSPTGVLLSLLGRLWRERVCERKAKKFRFYYGVTVSSHFQRFSYGLLGEGDMIFWPLVVYKETI